MPTVLNQDGFRFFFYSNENQEPAHVHVERGEGAAKIWLTPVSLASAFRMPARDQRRARELTEEHVAEFLKAWENHHGRA